MRAGRLNNRVTFKSRSSTQDAFGEKQTTWTTVTTVWADIRPLSGNRLMAAQAAQSQISHEITIRYLSSLSDTKTVAAMRIEYGNRIFDIHSVINLNERNQTLVLQCSEGVNNG